VGASIALALVAPAAANANCFNSRHPENEPRQSPRNYLFGGHALDGYGPPGLNLDRNHNGRLTPRKESTVSHGSLRLSYRNFIRYIDKYRGNGDGAASKHEMNRWVARFDRNHDGGLDCGEQRRLYNKVNNYISASDPPGTHMG
jgi:hypothetical protein